MYYTILVFTTILTGLEIKIKFINYTINYRYYYLLFQLKIKY